MRRGRGMDLLAAMLVGAAVGAGALALMHREDESGTERMLRRARRGAEELGRRGSHMMDAVPDARDLRRHAARARHAIDSAVRDELQDLRRSLRRRRKELGI